MYVTTIVLPVRADRRDDYVAWAEHSADLLMEWGCTRIVEAWEDEVPEGTRTDFRKAVAATPEDAIVVVWQFWPDKATLKAAEAKLEADPRAVPPPDLPFGPRRAIFGGFAPFLDRS